MITTSAPTETASTSPFRPERVGRVLLWIAAVCRRRWTSWSAAEL